MRARALVLALLLLGAAACGDTDRPSVDNSLPTPTTGSAETTTTEAGTTDGVPPAEVTTTRPQITTTTREPITTTTRAPITTTTRPEPTTTTEQVTTTTAEETTTTEEETTTTAVEETTTTAVPEEAAPATEEDDSFPWWLVALAVLLGGGLIAWLVLRNKATPLDPRWRAQAVQLLADLQHARDGLVAGAAPNSPVPDPQWAEVMTGSTAARTAADAIAADAPTEELRGAVVQARDAMAAVEVDAAAARGGAPTAGATLPVDTAALSTAMDALRGLLGPDPTPPTP